MNNNDDRFTFRARLHSFKHAMDGVKELLRGQHNAWMHCAATVSVILAAGIFSISRIEWLMLILAITLVWMAEALNTAIEFVCDAVSPEFHPLIKKSKDVAAGAVLISAIGAGVIGLIVFLPYLI